MSLKTNFRPSPKNLKSCKNVSMNVMCPQCPDRPQLVQSVLTPGPHSVQSVLTPVPTQSRDHTPVADKPLNSTHMENRMECSDSGDSGDSGSDSGDSGSDD